MSFGDLKVQDLIYEDASNNEITVVIADLATKANPTFTGTVTVPTATAGDNSTKAASTAFVVASFAPKASPTFTGTINGADLVLSGNLTVNGTQTIINTQTLDVEDKQIEIGKVSSPSDTTADQGGWKLKGATDKTFLWVNATDAWTSSEHIHLGDNKKILIGTGSDLQLYHNGSTSFLTDGIGDLRIRGDAVKIQSASGENSARFIANGAVELYYDNVKKLETSANGVVIQGLDTVTSVGSPAALQLEGGDADGEYVNLRLTTAAGGTLGNISAKAVTTGNYPNSVGELIFSIQNASATYEALKITSNRDINIPTDDKKLQLGASQDLQIYHTGSDSRIINTHAGDLKIRSQSLKLETTDAQEYIRCTADQDVKLFYDNVQKLNTSATGVSVSGTLAATAVTGDGSGLTNLPASGGIITATASGAISANDAVIVKTDGNVEKVTETITPGSNQTGSGSGVIWNQNNLDCIKMIYCTGTDFVVALYNMGSNPPNMYVRLGVLSGTNTITWNPSALQGHTGLDTIFGSVGPGRAKYDLAWDKDEQRLIIVAGYAYSNYWKARLFTVQNSGNGFSATSGAATIWTASTSGNRLRDNCISIKYIGSRRFLCGYVGTNVDMYGMMKVVEYNSDGTNITAGSQYNFPTGTSPDQRLVSINIGEPNAAGDIPVVFLKYNSNNGNKLFGRACTVSGTTISVGSEVQMSSATSGYGVYIDTNNYTLWPSISYDEDNDVYLVNYREHRGSGGNKFFCNAFKCTGTTFATIGSQRQLGNNTPQNLNVGVYDPIYNKHIVWVTDNHGWLKYFVVTTTTSGTPSTTSEIQTATNVAETYSCAFIDTVAGTTWNKHIFAGTLGTGGGQSYAWKFGPFATSSTNMTDSNFIGFSSATYSNGNTATINIVGNTTTKSGLEAGRKYYVQANGILKTTAITPSVVAGTALSSTKLLIKPA